MGEEAQANPVYINVPSCSPPSPLDLEENRSDNWKLWKQQWGNYLIVSGLDTKPAKYVVALLLHSVGKDALRLYNGMDLTDEDKNDPKEILMKFDELILGETSDKESSSKWFSVS